MMEKSNPPHQRGGESEAESTKNASGIATGPTVASAERTDEEVLPILPKGFVENTTEVYAEVASYDVIPPEKLREYWRVYTITNRRLCDPTAKRLESFWWHVWGSKLRYSSGDTLAKLYESISTGPTFVPLRGPANRYEGPPSTDRILVQLQPPGDAEVQGSSHQPSQVNLGSSSRAAYSKDRGQTYDSVTKDCNDNAAANDAEVTQHSVDTAAADEVQPQASVKVLSSSASRPPPAQSILKKPRPSLSGSRPTPRFTLPADIPLQYGIDDHASAGTTDTVGSSSFASGSGSVSSGLAAEPSPSSACSSRSGPRMPGGHKQTRTKQTKKKFVATATKRKAFVLKRSGSQISSTVSDGSGQQETRRLEPPKSSSGERFQPEGVDEQIAISPPKSEPLTLRLAPEDEQVGLQSFEPQPQILHRQGIASPSMSDTLTTDKQAAQLHISHSPSALSAAARLEHYQSTGSSFTSAAPTFSSEIRSRHQNSASIAPPMVRGYSSLDIRVGSREILGHPSPRLIRHMTLPQEIRPSAAPTSAARSSPIPSTSLDAAAGRSSRPSTPGAGSFVAPMLLRSTSQDGSTFWSRRGSETVSSPTAALASPSMVAARGVFSDADGPDPFRVYATTGLSDPLEEDDDDEQQESSFQLGRSDFSYTDPNPLHRPMFTPTRPSPTPRIPFARTRSQLNVILDREKARLGQNTFASWQESRTGRDTPRSTAEGSDIQSPGQQ